MFLLAAFRFTDRLPRFRNSGNLGICGESIFRVAGSSGSRCISRIPAGSEVFIKAIEDLHILCGNLKVKNIGIFEDASTIGRFGNHRQSMLQRPADEDLRRRFGFRMAGQPV
jgi:hypothetical protein